MHGMPIPSRLALVASHLAWRLSELQGAPAPTPPPPYPPAREAQQFVSSALHGAWHLFIALLLAWLGARCLHRRRLDARWATWGLGLVLFLYLAPGAGLLRLLPWVGGLGATAWLVGLWVAAQLACRWQAAEEQHAPPGLLGATHPRTPGQALKALVARIDSALAMLSPARPSRPRPRLTRIRELPPLCAALVSARATTGKAPCPRSAGTALLLGRDIASDEPAYIARGHTIVVGTTGSGKTVTLRRLVQSALHRMGAVAIDGKGDPGLQHDLERFARETGRRFTAWSPALSTRYNPFAHGADTEIVDKALAAESFGDDYYLRLGQRFLGFAVRALRMAGVPPTVQTLARYAHPDGLEELAPAIEERAPGAWNDLLATLPRLGASERQAIAGTQHRLAALAESDIGALLEPAPGCETITLAHAVANGDVVYFNLSADARPELSRMLGAAIVRDLVSIAASLQAARAYAATVALLDDVQAFATPACMRAIASLCARSRSVGMMTLLGTQSLSDLEAGNDRGPREQLKGDRSALIVHRLPSWESATEASRELGDHEHATLSERLTGGPGRWRSTGHATRSTAAMPNVPARELAALPTGVAVLAPTGERPRVVSVLPPS